MGVLRALSKNELGEELLVHVPIQRFCGLHRLNPRDLDLWEHMNLRSFFDFPLWGLDYLCADQAFNIMMDNNDYTITDYKRIKCTYASQDQW